MAHVPFVFDSNRLYSAHKLGGSMDNKKIYAAQLLESVNGDIRAALRELQTANQLKKQTSTYTPKNSEVAIQVTNVTKRYKMGKTTVDALKGASVTVHKGEFVAITGSSGSGKSTLLQLIGGLDKPTDGDIVVQGVTLRKMGDAKLSHFRNRTIGFVFQFFYLQPFLRLQTNIEVPAMFARTKPQNRQKRSKELAETVGLSDRLRHFPKELSGGQMQRAAIARALQNAPSILLADEPTGNLDQANATAIFELFKKIRDENGTTIIVVTHDLRLASIADRSIQMIDGTVIAESRDVAYAKDNDEKLGVKGNVL